MGTALVTGASSGLGRALAIEVADRGHDVVLVARDEPRLALLAGEIAHRYAVRTEVLPADLADRVALQRVADRVADRERPVDLLVNNAGFGLKQRLSTGDLALEERALDVMVRAVLVLSHAAAGAMRERRRGAILNVSSVAGFSTMGTYAAIKSWVTVFSESLATDLADRGVTVTALCPGFVRTEFHERADIDLSMLPSGLWLHAHRVAQDALDDVSAGRVLSVPSVQYRAISLALRLLPRPVVRRASGQLALSRRSAGRR